MNLWNTREKSLQWLEEELSKEAKAIHLGFQLIDECIIALDKTQKIEGANLHGRFARICGLTTAKARNLILSCYSLTLDALAQEAGALLRVLIETNELLIYLCQEPDRVDKAISVKLPSAGNIGKAIGGSLQSLRTHLNDHAYHFSLKYESCRHIFDIKTISIKSSQTHSLEVLRSNITMVNVFQVFILIEAINCLHFAGNGADDLAAKAEVWRRDSIEIFKQSDIPSGQV